MDNIRIRPLPVVLAVGRVATVLYNLLFSGYNMADGSLLATMIVYDIKVSMHIVFAAVV